MKARVKEGVRYKDDVWRGVAGVAGESRARSMAVAHTLLVQHRTSLHQDNHQHFPHRAKTISLSGMDVPLHTPLVTWCLACSVAALAVNDSLEFAIDEAY